MKLSFQLLSQQRSHRKGSILVMSIFFMLILFITASAFITLLPVEGRAAQRTLEISQGSLVCEAGVNDALTWLRFQLEPPTGASKEPLGTGVYPSASDRTRELGDGWSYTWSLTADSQTYPNGSNPLRAYAIEVVAKLHGRDQHKARADVMQASMLDYGQMFNTWSTNLVMGVDSDDAPLGGKVHVNDKLTIWIKDGLNFWNDSSPAPFDKGLTASGVWSPSQDGFGYYQGNRNGSDPNRLPYDSNGPIVSRYERMVKGGRDNLVAGAAEVQFPTNTFRIGDAAWGFNASTTPPTSGNSVILNTVAGKVQGIYVQGDVEEMELGFGGSQPAAKSGGGTTPISFGDNSWVKMELPVSGQQRIDNNECVTVVSVDSQTVTLPAGSYLNGAVLATSTTIGTGGTLVRRPNGRFESYNGQLNGSVYVNGNINDLWGVNKGRRTIAVATDLSNRRDIYIGGKENDSVGSGSNGAFSTAAGQKGLIQWGATDADGDGILDEPSNADNALGLVANRVRISQKLKGTNNRWDSNNPQTNPLYLFASVLGGIEGSNNGTYDVQGYGDGGAGWAYTYGSQLMSDAGAWGTTSGHGLVEGTQLYDKAAAQNPPPYFPALPTFNLKAYDESIVTRTDWYN